MIDPTLLALGLTELGPFDGVNALMTSHTATIRWARNAEEAFRAGRYSRAHEWTFDGGSIVRASASPHNVPPGTADEAGVDPEEAFIAAISSCHMLFFIDHARRGGFVVDAIAMKQSASCRRGWTTGSPARASQVRPRSQISTNAPTKIASLRTQSKRK